ncbi:MAG: FtsQ-type POTRA domain-containing protein [Luteitalea sp.]|nr:FtsQ-type POTRA domain-containing protein [Luteitalea sp.]
MRLALVVSLVALVAHSARAAPVQAGAAEVVAEVRVQGNHTTPDDEILRLAGVTIGEPLSPGATEQIAARLRSSGRFRQVEVRKRYRSLEATREVAFVVIVEEVPGRTGGTIAAPVRWLRRQSMFFPMLSYRDGYGVTYGLRTSFVETFGARSRVSVPLTWGATKRAALEVEKTFRAPWVHRLEGGVSIAEEENPHFRADDQRVRLWGRAERALVPGVRVGAQAGWSDVELDDRADRFVSYGGDLTFDTRTNPAFPRDAVYTSVGWEGLSFNAWPTVQRRWIDARGYLGLVRQSVLAVRARYDGANRALPPYQQPLLGGASSLRGFRAGTFIGDNLLTTSVELRLPMTSPLGGGGAGVTVFWDSGTSYADGERLRRARFHHGVGAGLFLQLPFFPVQVDVAHGFDNRVRVHVMSGFAF